MSIPRAKITAQPNGVAAECSECPWGGAIRGDASYVRGIATRASLRHLRDAHGVRTVGSLTADDIGKWIDLGKYVGKLDRFSARAGEVFIYVSKPFGPTINPAQRVIETAQWWPSSTPCRVTEGRRP